MRVHVEGQWFLLYHFEGGGRNQIRFKIPVLTTTRHPDISGAQPVTQFRERAQFIEVPIHSAGCKHMGSPPRFHETGRHVLGQRTLPAGIEIAEQIESLQQLVRSRRGMEFKMREKERRELTHATVSLVDRFAAGVELLGVGTFRSLESIQTWTMATRPRVPPSVAPYSGRPRGRV